MYLFFDKHIRTFVCVKFNCTNIFGYSFVSVLECKNCLNIQIYSNVRTTFNTNIYLDIRSCQICYMNIFGYSFVYIFQCKYIGIFLCVKENTKVTLWLKPIRRRDGWDGIGIGIGPLKASLRRAPLCGGNKQGRYK